MEEKKNSNKVIILLIIIIVILALLVVLFATGVIKLNSSNASNTSSTTSESSSTSTIEELNDGNLDIQGVLVQKLYSYVYYNKLTGTQTASSMSDDTKIELAFKLITDADKGSISCNKYAISSYYKATTDMEIGCGTTSNYNSIKDDKFTNDGTTILIKEAVVQEKVNQIFGPSTYKHVDNFTNCVLGGYHYSYIASESGFIGLYGQFGCGVGVFPSKTLESAAKNGNVITLNVSNTYTDGTSATTTIYTFTKGNDSDNYYFTKMETK
jgi:hypothetical protein